MIRNKYLRTKSIHEFNVKAAKSQFWAGLIHIREIFYRYCRKEVRNGKNTCFWEDWWVGDSPLKVTYSRLYNLTERNFITVETVRKEGWGCFKFRRYLWGDTLQLFMEMVRICDGIPISQDSDKCVWLLDKKGVFTIQEKYTY